MTEGALLEEGHVCPVAEGQGGRWRAAEFIPQKAPESSCFHLGHMATIPAPYL